MNANQPVVTVNQVQFLQAQMRELPMQGTAREVDSLVATYLAAKEQMGVFAGIGAEAKGRIAQIMNHTGQEVWTVPSGKVIIPASATIITYDAHALDNLAALSHAFRRKVFPFRNETVRQGGMRITPHDI